MKKELDEKLVKDFPNLYADRNHKKSCMYFGFSCGDGWYDIIYNLSDKLEKLILLEPEDRRQDYKASQVKEKFATMRFYMSHSTKEMELLIDQAEDLTAITCEECGQPGKCRTGGWIRTLCDEHAKNKS